MAGNKYSEYLNLFLKHYPISPSAVAYIESINAGGDWRVEKLNKRNSEGYMDLTAYEALTAVDKTEKAAKRSSGRKKPKRSTESAKRGSKK